jgi:hypothetical protein
MAKRRVREDDAYEIRPEWLNLLPIVAAILATANDSPEFNECVDDALELLADCTAAADAL